MDSEVVHLMNTDAHTHQIIHTCIHITNKQAVNVCAAQEVMGVLVRMNQMMESG